MSPIRYAFTTDLALNAAFPDQITSPSSPGQVRSYIPSYVHCCFKCTSNLNVFLQIAARSFIEATLKTAKSGSYVQLPESRDECAKLLAGIQPSPDHMHWSAKPVSFAIMSSAVQFFNSRSRFEYNFLFILAAGGSEHRHFHLTHDGDCFEAARNCLNHRTL
jgi:hypothetical protein